MRGTGIAGRGTKPGKERNRASTINNTFHDTAKRIVEMFDAAKATIGKAGGNDDEARDKIIELVTED